MEGKSKREVGVLTGKTDTFKSGYAKITSVPIY